MPAGQAVEENGLVGIANWSNIRSNHGRAERWKLLVNKRADHELDDAGLDEAQHATVSRTSKRIRAGNSSVFKAKRGR